MQWLQKQTKSFWVILFFGLSGLASASSIDVYKTACNNADLEGCYRLGLAYANGEGVRQDMETARSFLQLSCDEGIADACTALRTLATGDKSKYHDKQPALSVPVQKGNLYGGHVNGKFQADIYRDGKKKKSFKKPFSNLNFTVAVHYTPRALRKLREGNEKVTVNAIIDQYGKQYMEEEAISYKEITIIPGDKAVFHEMPPTESSYRYKKNKKYVVTINIYSARNVFKNNILSCSGKIDFDIKNIKGKVLEFECDLF